MDWTDELVEVTPKSVRMRKAILDSEVRKKAQKAQTGIYRSANVASAPPPA